MRKHEDLKDLLGIEDPEAIRELPPEALAALLYCYKAYLEHFSPNLARVQAELEVRDAEVRALRRWVRSDKLAEIDRELMARRLLDPNLREPLPDE